MSASSIVSKAECAIICSSYRCLRLTPTPLPTADPAALGPVFAPPAADASAEPVDVGILESRPPNIPPAAPVLALSGTMPWLVVAELAPDENMLPVADAEEEEDAVLGVISVS